MFQITYKELCFAGVIQDGVVVATAPVGTWMIGKSWEETSKYWRKRGAKVEVYE